MNSDNTFMTKLRINDQFFTNYMLYFSENHHISIRGPRTLRLTKETTNVTAECHGYGKPLPSVVWRKGGKEVLKVGTFSKAYANQVVQVLENVNSSEWNITNRLYLRTSGITYNESGNYTCEVFNGVGTNYSETESIEILCE